MSLVPALLSLPFTLTLGAIPLTYALGLISGNVSWVDRAWPFYPVICSSLIVYSAYNHPQAIYRSAIPRALCMLGLQYVWSIRLTTNAIKRDFYDLSSEDYRYKEFRKLVPGWIFQLVHIFVIAISQPALLFALSIPVYMTLHLSALGNPGTSLTFADILIVLNGLAIVYIEYTADNQMYAYQSAKYASKSTDRVTPPPSKSTYGPQPASYPRAFHPGYITTGLFKNSRHPNFAAEQLFWLNQAFFTINAGVQSGVPRNEWFSFWPIFGPAFALSLLFCSSTFLTEWITGRKYPTYREYKILVGQFLPQETLLIRLWTGLRGKTKQAADKVFKAPATK